MASSIDKIREYYDQNAQRENERLSIHRLEYEVTCLHVNEYLPKDAFILDIGGGPGKYAIYLAQNGHSVCLLDISEECIGIAANESERSGVHLQAAAVGDARDLSRYANGTFDAVLCLGPLYYLHSESDRCQAITECLRVLKNGGVAFFGFISKYAPITDLVKNSPERIFERTNTLREFIETGVQVDTASAVGWTDAFFIDPLQLCNIMAPFKMTELAIVGVEGMVAQSENRIYEKGEAVTSAWADFIYRTGKERAIVASSEHIIYIGQKDQ